MDINQYGGTPPPDFLKEPQRGFLRPLETNSAVLQLSRNVWRFEADVALDRARERPKKERRLLERWKNVEPPKSPINKPQRPSKLIHASDQADVEDWSAVNVSVYLEQQEEEREADTSPRIVDLRTVVVKNIREEPRTPSEGLDLPRLFGEMEYEATSRASEQSKQNTGTFLGFWRDRPDSDFQILVPEDDQTRRIVNKILKAAYNREKLPSLKLSAEGISISSRKSLSALPPGPLRLRSLAHYGAFAQNLDEDSIFDVTIVTDKGKRRARLACLTGLLEGCSTTGRWSGELSPIGTEAPESKQFASETLQSMSWSEKLKERGMTATEKNEQDPGLF